MSEFLFHAFVATVAAGAFWHAYWALREARDNTREMKKRLARIETKLGRALKD